jgi:hypothetical protein
MWRSNRGCPTRPCVGLSKWAIPLITLRAEYSQEMGRGQAIIHNSRTATNYAASDPRSDGAAVPEPIRASEKPA